MFSEVYGKDGRQPREFYAGLLGWSFTEMGAGAIDYGMAATGDGGVGVRTAPDGGSGHVTFFVRSDDVARSLS